MWRGIWRQVLVRSASWACCDDTSSDDDEHNTSNAFLLLIAPVLLSGFTDVDERTVALGCRFSSDVFTIARQDRALADLHPLPHDPGHCT